MIYIIDKINNHISPKGIKIISSIIIIVGIFIIGLVIGIEFGVDICNL